MVAVVNSRELFGRKYGFYIEEYVNVNIQSTIDGTFYYAILSEEPGKFPDVSANIIASTSGDKTVTTAHLSERTGGSVGPQNGEYRIDGQRIYTNKPQNLWVFYYGVGDRIKAEDNNDLNTRVVYLEEGSISPAGSAGDVQFNADPVMGANSLFNWDNDNTRLTIADGASLRLGFDNPSVGEFLRATSIDGDTEWADPASNIDHNSTISIQGGNGSTEYYHLNLIDYNALTDGNSQLLDLHTDGSPTLANLTVTSLTPDFNVISTDTNGLRFDVTVDDTNKMVCLSSDQTTPIGADPSIRIGVNLDDVNAETRSININGQGFIGIDGDPTNNSVVTIYDDNDDANNTIMTIVADDDSPWAFRISNQTYSGSTSPSHTFRFLVADDGAARLYAPNAGTPGAMELRTADTERLGISNTGVVNITSNGLTLSAGTSTTPIFVANSTVVPGTPVGGGYFYVEAGAAKYIGSSGTITTVGPA